VIVLLGHWTRKDCALVRRVAKQTRTTGSQTSNAFFMTA
jgi:hypothetical protein